MEDRKILVVDDESRMRKLLKDYLVREDYEVLEAADGESAVDLFFSEKDIALILLDVMMPKMDGYEALKRIREKSRVPVIMLTARSDEEDELRGFELGVDEYISKPVRPRVLVARINAVLRRTSPSAADVIESCGIVIDKSAHQVTIGGRPVALSLKEFELLTFFMENKGVALSRERILNSVWNYDYYGDPRTIDTHVKKLRSKLGEKESCIITVHGIGYKFVEPDQTEPA